MQHNDKQNIMIYANHTNINKSIDNTTIQTSNKIPIIVKKWAKKKRTGS